MSSLSAVGSGLDIPTIVSNLVAAERAPAENRINLQGTEATAKLSALGSIKSSLTSLQTSLQNLGKTADSPGFKASVADKAGYTASIVTDSAGKTLAAAGTYDIEVLSLATHQKLSSAAFDKDAVVGDGKLTLSWGEETLEVEIEPGSNLSAVAATINRTAGGKGVNATIITSDQGQHLVLNAVNAGTEGALKVAASGGNGGLEQLTWDGSAGSLTQTNAATNARVRVDGFERQSSSNTLTDVIAGVSLTLTEANEGTVKKLTVAADNGAAKSAVQAFVTAYNSTVSLLRSSSAYDATNDKAAILTGDSQVRSLQQQLRNQLSANVVALKDLGVEISKEGTLTFNASKFDTTLASTPDAATKLFGKESALYTNLDSILSSTAGSSGTLTQRTDAITKQLAKLDKELDELDLRMEKVRTRYTAQFTAMDTLVTQMQATSDYFSQQMESLKAQTR